MLKGAAMNGMSICLVDLEEAVARMEVKKSFWQSLMQNYFLLLREKGFRLPT